MDLIKRYLSLLEYFLLYQVQTGENAIIETNTFNYAQATSANSELSEDNSLSENIRKLVKKGNVGSIPYCDKELQLFHGLAWMSAD